ncbi:MAG: cytochrome c biogenesis protein [Deltaproteobacteria bacterium]|nr:cytochrome c biogenesis protein [Deltaproteobacteria bacterium]
MFRWLVIAGSIFFFLSVGAIYWAPKEVTLSVSQKILYFKLGCIVTTYFLVTLSFTLSIVSLWRNSENFNLLIRDSLQLAFIPCSLGIVMGALWGKYAWNTFFSLEPRLLSFLVLWVLLFSGVMVRQDARANQFFKTLSLVAFMMIPVVKLSIDFVPEKFRLHPQILEKGGMSDFTFQLPMYLSIIFVLLLFITILHLTFRVSRIKVRYFGG